MPQVRSKVNGLIINIPSDAAGVVNRFKSAGDNELIFEGGSIADTARVAKKATPMKVESETKSRARPRSSAAALA